MLFMLLERNIRVTTHASSAQAGASSGTGALALRPQEPTCMPALTRSLMLFNKAGQGLNVCLLPCRACSTWSSSSPAGAPGS